MSSPIVDALMRTSALLASHRLVCEGPPFTCTNGLPSLSTMEWLYQSYQTSQPLSIGGESPFLTDIDRLYQLPLQEKVFRTVYLLRNQIYYELTKDHKQALFVYDPKKVDKTCQAMTRRARKLITLTMTTCKRFDLFERTMNSILTCVTDLHDHIADWIVVDDNSEPS